MAVGNSTFKGLAVPLWGESDISQDTAGNDILTLTRLTGATDDFLVFRDDGGTEVGSFSSSGGGAFAAEFDFDGGIMVPNAQYVRFSVPVTTPPTTGLTKGDFFVVLGTSSPQLAVCYSTAANSLKYTTLQSKTFGRGTGA